MLGRQLYIRAADRTGYIICGPLVKNMGKKVPLKVLRYKAFSCLLNISFALTHAPSSRQTSLTKIKFKDKIVEDVKMATAEH